MKTLIFELGVPLPGGHVVEHLTFDPDKDYSIASRLSRNAAMTDAVGTARIHVENGYQIFADVQLDEDRGYTLDDIEIHLNSVVTKFDLVKYCVMDMELEYLYAVPKPVKPLGDQDGRE